MERLQKIFEDNKDSVLINTIYERDNDALMMVFKNSKTGNKKMVTLFEPCNRIFITKNTKPKEWKLYERRDNLDEVYVREQFKQWRIAELLGKKSQFINSVREGEYSADMIYLNKRLYAADIDIEDNTLRAYTEFHTKRTKDGLYESTYPVIQDFHLGGLDIETDIKVSSNMTEQPVIMNTYIDNKLNRVYTYCLINEEYKGQKEVMNNLEKVREEIKDFLLKHIDSISFGNSPSDIERAESVKKLIKPFAEKLIYDIRFTNKEEEVIMNINKKIFSEINPDFLLIYNAQFDINQQMTRLKELGINPKEMFRYKDEADYVYINTKNQNQEFKKRYHYFDIHNPTKIVDQMLLYYQLRAGNSYAKYSLDATANREVGVGKLDYSHICNWIGDFPYTDYKTFLIYNIVDTISMIFIDMVTLDLFSVVYDRLDSCVEWNKVTKSIPSVSNAYDFYPELDGYIRGCNTNKLMINLNKKQLDKVTRGNKGLRESIEKLQITAKSKKKEDNPYRIEGGLVTSPNKIKSHIKETNLYKIPVKTWFKFANLIDYDATSMYPSNNKVNNASKDSLVGKISKINGKYRENLERETALSLINQNIGSIGYTLFNLPNIHDIINKYHSINPVIKNKADISYMTEDIISFEHLAKNKNYTRLKTVYNALYNTRYEKQDIEGGRPSKNKLFFMDSRNHVEFSYYSTKVELDCNINFNELIGYEKEGFVCGHLEKNNLENLNKEYRDFLIPKKEEFTTTFVSSGIIDDDVIYSITNAKIQAYDFTIGEIKMYVINRLFFFNSKYCNNLRYELYDINEDSNLFKLVLKSQVPIGENTINITQSIVGYKIKK